jgi:hypothetical protein
MISERLPDRAPAGNRLDGARTASGGYRLENTFRYLTARALSG